MIELSELLKISKAGELITLDIKKADGTVVIPGKSNEDAMVYSNILDKVNNICKSFWDEASLSEVHSSASNQKQ